MNEAIVKGEKIEEGCLLLVQQQSTAENGQIIVALINEEATVKVFEREHQIGGLATYHDYEHFIWDRFYHVILPGDSYLLDFIKSLGLEQALRWDKTYTGVYVDKHFYSVSNNKEFLLFILILLFR